MPPFEIIRDTIVYAILPAALVAGFLLWLIDRLTKLTSLGAAIGFAVAGFVGQSLHSELRLASGESPWNRLAPAAIVALIAGVALRPIRLGHVAHVIFVVVVAGLFWWFVPGETLKEARWTTGLAALTAFLLWALLQAYAARVPGPDVPVSLALAFLTAAIVFVHAGSARLMDAGIVLFATCAGIAAVAWWKALDVGVMASGAAVLLPGMCLMAQQETFSDVACPAFILPAIAPLLLGITLLLPTWPERRRRMAGMALVSIAATAAVVLAMQAGPLEF